MWTRRYGQFSAFLTERTGSRILIKCPLQLHFSHPDYFARTSRFEKISIVDP